MIRHNVVGRVDTETLLSSYAMSNRRFARTAPATDPVDMLELFQCATVLLQRGPAKNDRRRVAAEKQTTVTPAAVSRECEIHREAL